MNDWISYNRNFYRLFLPLPTSQLPTYQTHPVSLRDLEQEHEMQVSSLKDIDGRYEVVLIDSKAMLTPGSSINQTAMKVGESVAMREVLDNNKLLCIANYMKLNGNNVWCGTVAKVVKLTPTITNRDSGIYKGTYVLRGVKKVLIHKKNTVEDSFGFNTAVVSDFPSEDSELDEDGLVQFRKLKLDLLESLPTTATAISKPPPPSEPLSFSYYAIFETWKRYSEKDQIGVDRNLQGLYDIYSQQLSPIATLTLLIDHLKTMNRRAPLFGKKE
jgi:hypothetical protein